MPKGGRLDGGLCCTGRSGAVRAAGRGCCRLEAGGATESARTSQEPTDGRGGLSALPNGPDHQGLSPSEVPGGENLGDVCCKVARVSEHVAARVEGSLQLFEKSLMHGMDEPKGEQHQVRGYVEVGARYGHWSARPRSVGGTGLDPHRVQLADLAVGAG